MQNNATQKSWILDVKGEGDNLYIELSDEILEEIGWKPYDSLIWKDNENGTWTITKKDDV